MFVTISRETRILKGSVCKITRRLLTCQLRRKKLLPHNEQDPAQASFLYE